MSITFKVNGKNGDYVRATVIPANHSEEPHFGAIDATIIGIFLVGVCSLVYLLVVS